MKVFRLSQKRYAYELSGKGAAIKGGRWNSSGVEMIYTAANRSLAMAEVAVHFSLATMPEDYMMITIEIPIDISILKLKTEDLPNNWNVFPHPNSTQKWGDKFVSNGKCLLMEVPSVVTKGDFNYLINVHQQDFEKVKIVEVEPFPFDRRIFK